MSGFSIGTMFIELASNYFLSWDKRYVLALYRNQIKLGTTTLNVDIPPFVTPGTGDFNSENVILSCVHDCGLFLSGRRERLDESEKKYYEEQIKQTFSLFQNYNVSAEAEELLLIRDTIEKNKDTLNKLRYKGGAALWTYFLAACNILCAYALLDDKESATKFLKDDFINQASLFLGESINLADENAPKRLTPCQKEQSGDARATYVFYLDDKPNVYTDSVECEQGFNQSLNNLSSNNNQIKKDLSDTIFNFKQLVRADN